MAGGALIACPHCNTLHERTDPGRNARAFCSCCGAELYRRGRLLPAQWLALVWTSLIVFVLAQAFPIARLTLGGHEAQVTFWQALHLCWDRGYYSVSILTGLAGFWFPLMRIVLTLHVLQGILRGRRGIELHGALHTLRWLQPWAMTSVLVLGILVAFVKLAGLAHVEVGVGLPAFFVLIFLLAGLSRWDASALWRLAEDRALVPRSGSLGTGAVCDACGFVQPDDPAGCCRRCGSRLAQPGRSHASEVWALVLAAALFYLPANLLPVMRVQTLLGSSAHTILGGVVELWRMGSWDLAVIVFVASVLVPVTKLLALSYLLLDARPRGAREQRRRTRLFVFVERIGQWSMLDVFVVVLLAAMANFPGFSQILLGPAALSFGMVVVLTMAATQRYDPRRGWMLWREGRRA